MGDKFAFSLRKPDGMFGMSGYAAVGRIPVLAVDQFYR